MTFDPSKHRRRSVRLQGFDYSRPGLYFITLVTFRRGMHFGQITEGILRSSAIGEMVSDEWVRSASLRAEIRLDSFILMPNHLHGVVALAPTENQRIETATYTQEASGPAGRSLASFVAGFKAAATRRFNEAHGTRGVPLWQRSFHDHIIRDEESLLRIRRYIAENPARWEVDPENPARQVP